VGLGFTPCCCIEGKALLLTSLPVIKPESEESGGPWPGPVYSRGKAAGPRPAGEMLKRLPRFKLRSTRRPISSRSEGRKGNGTRKVMPVGGGTPGGKGPVTGAAAAAAPAASYRCGLSASPAEARGAGARRRRTRYGERPRRGGLRRGRRLPKLSRNLSAAASSESENHGSVDRARL
jgi:hypothetical protein